MSEKSVTVISMVSVYSLGVCHWIVPAQRIIVPLYTMIQRNSHGFTTKIIGLRLEGCISSIYHIF